MSAQDLFVYCKCVSLYVCFTYELVGVLSPVSHKGYIRAEGDFHKEMYSLKDQ